MKKGLSYKDLLLLAGIVVAVIVALTMWVYTENPSEASRLAPAPKKQSVLTAPAAAIRKLAGTIRVAR